MQDNSDYPLYVRATDSSPIYRLAPKMNRNEICKLKNIKFKNCCGKQGSNFCRKLLKEYLDSALNKQDPNKDDQVS